MTNPMLYGTASPMTKEERERQEKLASSVGSSLEFPSPTPEEIEAAARAIKWPLHKAAMHITHNDHKSVYETVEDWLRSPWFEDGDDFISDEERRKAIETDSVWEIQWYPETPVGFCRVLASTFEAALKAAMAVRRGK